jgi:preprotein translocase subunit Sec61beta
VPVGVATGLVVLSALLALMLYAFSQPVALFWFVIGTGLSAGLMRFLPAEDATVDRLSPVLVSAAGWAVAACGFMLSVLVLIIAGGLAGAAGAAMAWRRQGPRAGRARQRVKADVAVTSCDGGGRLCADRGCHVFHAAQPAVRAGQQDV